MYQVLYRKWRPGNFSDVVGQRAIIATLKNEIATGKISHAYLFTGSRGTGKTTCAKIFAKAVNCKHPKDGEPCNECEICRGIDDGTVLDVEEIDAASNNGVDNIREIRDEVNFTPVQAKYRVYIIDEVHMLSAGAFNALLKTLEEPPAHVIFILATTEVHKLPATILSRCQRFDFGRISSEDIAGRLKTVAKSEGIELDDEAALLIAGLADGGMRDALSLLDRCNTGEALTAERAGEILGLASKENLFGISSALRDRNLALCLEIIKRMNDSCSDISRVADQLVNHFRNIMIAKAVKDPGELIVCQREELVRYMNAGEGFSMGEILEILDVFRQTAEKMKKAASKRVELEMAFVSLCINEQSKGVSGAPVQNGPQSAAQSFPNAAQNGAKKAMYTADESSSHENGRVADFDDRSALDKKTYSAEKSADIAKADALGKVSAEERIAALKKAAFADKPDRNFSDKPTDNFVGSLSDKPKTEDKATAENDQSSIELAERAAEKYRGSADDDMPPWDEDIPDFLPYEERMQTAENGGRSDGQSGENPSVQKAIELEIGAEAADADENVGITAETETAKASFDGQIDRNMSFDDMPPENSTNDSQTDDNGTVNIGADNTTADSPTTDGASAENEAVSVGVHRLQNGVQAADTENRGVGAEREAQLQNGGEPERFGKWPEVLAALSEINRMLSSTLRASSAYIKGDNLLLIKSENPMFFELIRKESKNKSDIRTALLKITGKQFRLGPYEQGAAKPKADPMRVFLDEMKQKGINIVEKQ